jgi:GLPGLI family protein
MRKLVFFYFLSLPFFHNVNAQIPVFRPFARDVSNLTTVDSANMRIWYAFNAEDINRQESYDDFQRLEIGLYSSKYYSYFVYNSDSLCTEWRKKNKNAQSIPYRMGPEGKKSDLWSEYRFSEYYKFFSDNIFTEYARMPRGISHRFYSENIPLQNWKIENDTLTIVGHLCQKATCRFRGRIFTAWFTKDIPVNNGPWKFGGLPGLILKIYDHDNLYAFECTCIEYHEKKYPIKMADYNNYEKSDRKKTLQIQKEINEDYFKIMGIIPVGGTKMPEKVPYHPLELE